MLNAARDWLGFGPMGQSFAGHDHSEGSSPGHTHGVIDASITTTQRGIWAIKWSFVILAVTALLAIHRRYRFRQCRPSGRHDSQCW